MSTPAAFAAILDTLRTIWNAGRRGPRLRPWRWLLCVYLLISCATRCALLLYTGSAIDPSFGRVVSILLTGTFFDLVTASFLFLPLIVTLAVLPGACFRSRVGRLFVLAGMSACVFVLFFIAAAEWMFWDEFGARFNFIAVDYLVYTHEVLRNLWESYPIARILAGLGGLSVLAVWLQRKFILDSSLARFRYRDELLAAMCLMALPILAYHGVDAALHQRFLNRYANELAGNGVYAFFHAFEMAELDYTRFYPTLPRLTAYRRARHLIPANTHQTYPDPNPVHLTRETRNPPRPRALNVVLVSVESLSAEFMQHFGNPDALTPNLDRLAREGLFFSNFYATGTRTVRGLEALALSVPPTPGESIIKRPANTGLVTIGEILREQGY
ncbi:MAG: LTA synthase family protein, partial [Gammaproteobacteria bacterium]